MTNVRPRLAMIADAVLLAGGADSGIAMASTHTTAPAGTPTGSVSTHSDDREDHTGADRDQIQRGGPSARDHGRSDDSREHERSGEAPGNRHEDGPGGHADSSNSVDHKFVGKE
ncbi:hypothetical protein ACFRU3_48500 [Streptomyces sp. NPDC056910]|uniref:hypothetical protein n=1 Tax=Streptomyces sp. NPDC056910 TaxID=3345964 RepID=UPI0036825DFF